MSVVVLRELELPIESMAGLVDVAAREGDRSLHKLLEEYTRGAKLYRGRGEAILVAWEHSVVIGLIAVRRVDEETGHISVLFVAPEDRRRGIARELTRRAVELARKTHARLEAQGPDAFFSAVGFARVSGDPHATHCKRLSK